jgi:hypothetical protein
LQFRSCTVLRLEAPAAACLKAPAAVRLKAPAAAYPKAPAVAHLKVGPSSRRKLKRPSAIVDLCVPLNRRCPLPSSNIEFAAAASPVRLEFPAALCCTTVPTTVHL